MTPTKITPSRIAIASIVFAALRASGGLNAGTPLAMASTPVSATEPLANARSTRKMPMASVPNSIASAWRGSAPRSRSGMLPTIPDAMIMRAMVTNRYVGTAKMLPDSRRPRRFAMVISAMTPTATSIRSTSSAGTIEINWSIADDVETATVMT